MVKRFIASILSTIVLSLMMSFIIYTPISEREPNTAYDPFGAYFLIIFIIIGLAYLLGCIPISLLIDKYIRKNATKLLLYLISGSFVGVLTILIFALLLGGHLSEFNYINVVFFGALGGLIFYIVFLFQGK